MIKRTILALILLTVPAQACGNRTVHDYVSGQETEVKICANVTPYCIVGDEHVPCEDIPVFELTESDMVEPPPAMDVVNAWRQSRCNDGN